MSDCGRIEVIVLEKEGLMCLEGCLISRYKTFMCDNTNTATCTTYVHIVLAVIPHPPRK